MAFKLTAVLDNLDELPESIDPRELYTEGKDGKFELTGDGIKTVADVNRLQVSLSKERDDHKKTKLKIKDYGDYTPEMIEELVERAETAEANVGNGKGRPTDEQVQKLVDVKLAKAVKEYDKRIKALADENALLKGTNETLSTKDRSRQLRDAILDLRQGKAAIKIREEAIEDAELFLGRVMTFDEDGKIVTKDGVGVEPGQSVRELIVGMQTEGKRPHWFEETQGAGAGGGNGKGRSGGSEKGPNPFDKATFDFGAASKVMREDPIRGKRLIENAKDPSQARTVFAGKLG